MPFDMHEAANHLREIWDGYCPESEEDAIEDLKSFLAAIEAIQMLYFHLGDELLPVTGVRPEYPVAVIEAADGTGGVADQLSELISMWLADLQRRRLQECQERQEDEKPDWVQPTVQRDQASGYGLRHIDPRQVEMDVWRYQRGEQG